MKLRLGTENPAQFRPSILPLAGFWLLAVIPRLLLGWDFLDGPIALDDMYQYDMLARSLLSGNGFRWYAQADVEVLRPLLEGYVDLSTLDLPPEGVLTAHRAPGYPLFLAAIYGVVPLAQRFLYVRLVQVALTGLLSPLVVLIALKMGLKHRAALLAGFGMAFYPVLLLYPVALASENIFIPLLALGFYLLLTAAERRSWLVPLAAGLVLGLSILTRSILLPFVFLAAVWLWRNGRARWKGAVLFLAAALAVCLPWAVRNTQFLGRPAFVESGMGYNLFIGYHPEGNGGFVSNIAVRPLNILDDAERDRYCTQAALGYIAADPLEAGIRVFRRMAFFAGMEDRELIFFYSNNFFGHISQPWLLMLYLFLISPWVGTALLALPGVWLAPLRPAAWLAGALVLGYAPPHFFILAEPRFHLALVPILLPLGAWGWVERNKLFLYRKQPGFGGVLAGAAVLLLLWGWALAMNWNRLSGVMGPGGNQMTFSY